MIFLRLIMWSCTRWISYRAFKLTLQYIHTCIPWYVCYLLIKKIFKDYRGQQIGFSYWHSAWFIHYNTRNLVKYFVGSVFLIKLEKPWIIMYRVPIQKHICLSCWLKNQKVVQDDSFSFFVVTFSCKWYCSVLWHVY